MRWVWIMLLVIPAWAGCTSLGDDVPVRLVVTTDFGSTLLHDGSHHVPQNVSVIDLLYEATGGDLELAYGGRFVVGMFGARSDFPASQLDWFYEVDGRHQATGAGAVLLQGGERVQWDLRPWRTPLDVPGLFGSFPPDRMPDDVTPTEVDWDLVPGLSVEGDTLVTPEGRIEAPWGLTARTFPETSAHAVRVDGGLPPPPPGHGFAMVATGNETREIRPW